MSFYLEFSGIWIQDFLAHALNPGRETVLDAIEEQSRGEEFRGQVYAGLGPVPRDDDVVLKSTE